MIEPNLEHGAFLKAKVVVGQEGRSCTGCRSAARTDARTSAAMSGSSDRSANTGADCSRFDCALFAHATALEISFLTDRLDRAVARRTHYGRNERHRTMAGIDLVEAQQQAGMKARLNRAHVTFECFSAWDYGAV
jgi:hypothetical protein